MTGTILVVCTRNGHDRAEAVLRMFRKVSLQPREFQPAQLASADISRVNMRYVRYIEARCPVCGLGPKKFGRRFLAGEIAAGHAEIDISALPF